MYVWSVGFGPWAHGMVQELDAEGPARIGRRVRLTQPKCLYVWSVGFGPWAHGMALAPLGGPVIRALPNVILMT